MPFTIEHTVRFDAAGKLDADDWVLIPRGVLRHDFALDGTFADEMVRRYFQIVASSTRLVRVTSDAQRVRYVAPLGKTAMVFAEPERTVDAQRAETSWQIAGGFLLAHHVNYGGRFYLGAEWNKENNLRLYSSIRRYPPRWINWLGIPRGIAAYQRTQGVNHKLTLDKFLTELAQQVTSPKN